MGKEMKKTILVVDDEITVAKSIRSAILSDVYQVDTALSGEEALQKDRENPYSLIISDLMMPGISGLELLKTLKETRPDVLVIMVTGYPTIKTAVQSVKLGAFDYIPKPFTPNELRSLVARAFDQLDQETEGAPTAKSPPMPSGLYFMSGHTWLRRESEIRAVVGVLPEFCRAIQNIERVELPETGADTFLGEVCVRILDDRGNSHRVWSPASGRISSVNAGLAANPDLLLSDPFKSGWLFEIESPDLAEDLKSLSRSE
jgi:CheY-like chemotaxis protein/glycine cleavage system H lipoate-binding protein